ncbi:MAG: sugar phosphate isomerase/epimerase family protein [Limisphaerales bacterium]
MNRRSFLAQLAAASALPAIAQAGPFTGRIYKAVKVTMIRTGKTTIDKFKIAQDAGFDGISLFAPDRFDLREALAAQDKTGVKIHNVNGTYHWKERLSDPDPAVRQKAVQNLKDSIQFSADCGGSSVLLVNGKVTDPVKENHEHVRQRSIEGIEKALPLASRVGVRILCENVGNGFCPDAQQWADYLDSIDSPFVGAFFDIGNHHGLGGAPRWIRTLGNRVVKIDIKDRNLQRDKNCNLFDGHVDWAEVRMALQQIGFSGWATAEVGGGDAARMKQVAERMDQALGL